MKIRTNIKAGSLGPQHNEKMANVNKSKSLMVKTGIKVGFEFLNHNEKQASDNYNSFEQKKTIGKKLCLSRETIKELRDGDLKVVAGGRPEPTASICGGVGGCGG
jgi:hypothetical protein